MDGIAGDRIVSVVQDGRVATARIRPRLLGLQGSTAPDGTPLVDGVPWHDSGALEAVRAATSLPAAQLVADGSLERFDVLPLDDGRDRRRRGRHRARRPPVPTQPGDRRRRRPRRAPLAWPDAEDRRRAGVRVGCASSAPLRDDDLRSGYAGAGPAGSSSASSTTTPRALRSTPRSSRPARSGSAMRSSCVQRVDLPRPRDTWLDSGCRQRGDARRHRRMPPLRQPAARAGRGNARGRVQALRVCGGWAPAGDLSEHTRRRAPRAAARDTAHQDHRRLAVVPEQVGSSGPPWRLSAVKAAQSKEAPDEASR